MDKIIYQDSALKITRKRIKKEQYVFLVTALEDVRLAYAVAKAIRAARKNMPKKERTAEFEITTNRARMPLVEYEFENDSGEERKAYVRFPVRRVAISENRYNGLHEFVSIDGEVLRKDDSIILIGRYSLF